MIGNLIITLEQLKKESWRFEEFCCLSDFSENSPAKTDVKTLKLYTFD